MRVVDEETLGATDLETEAPKDEETKPPEDVEHPKEIPPPPPLERAAGTFGAPRPEPEFIGPEEEVEFTQVKPKRKPRKPKETKGEVLVPALEKPNNAFVEPSKLRNSRLKEKIECPNGCGKLITRHAASYTHDRTCAALKSKHSESQTDAPEESTYVEPDFHKKELEKAMRKPPEVPPNVEFMERLKKAALAYRQLEEAKHGLLIRQYFQR